MASMSALLRDSFDRGERRRLMGFFGGVGLLHVAGWGLLFAVAAGQPTILALGGLAYTFGLRHAFDADHIAAIDNTTRKLLQDGHKPVGVGFFFSLGHSTVVFLVAAALGLAVKWIFDGGQLASVGGVLGTVVSGGFLVLIGILNLIVLIDVVRVYRRLKSGEYDAESLELDLTAAEGSDPLTATEPLPATEPLTLTVFTPHADALAQARFVLMSPKHRQVDVWATDAHVQEQLEQLRSGGGERGVRHQRFRVARLRY